jgi:hypothetical protein
MREFIFLRRHRRQFGREWNIIRPILLIIISLSLVSTVLADKVGINFVGGTQARGTPSPLKPTEFAGVFSQKFWNNAYEATGKLSPVADAETISVPDPDFLVTWTAPRTNTNTITPFHVGNSRMFGIEGPPDYRLGLGYLEAIASQAVTITFTNIPCEFTTEGHSFSLVVYFHLDNIDFKNKTTNDKVNVFTLTGEKTGEKTICGLQSSGSHSFAQVPEESAKDEHENTPAGNYVVFSDLTDTNLVLTAKGGFSTDGDSRAAINAIQIIPFKKSE